MVVYHCGDSWSLTAKNIETTILFRQQGHDEIHIKTRRGMEYNHNNNKSLVVSDNDDNNDNNSYYKDNPFHSLQEQQGEEQEEEPRRINS